MADLAKKLTEFLDHFITITTSEGTDESEASFNKEFQALKLESQQYKDSNAFPADSGQLPVNKKKNRFKDILPFEYTRVQLHKMEGIEGSDYINANYIQGPDNNVTYIAAQGPLPHTVDDFWRMLWYHQIEIVVMACKEVEMAKPKCHAYWPPVGETVNFGAIRVTTNHEEQISDDFIIRQMTAECQGEQQIIRQFHYTAWPDHGRPMSATPIIRMIEMFHDYRKRHDIPFVVHCSAGCGRTGTIIAIDYARTLMMTESIPDDFSVYNIVRLMRRQRPAMVQALDQYVFVYMAIVELVQRKITEIPQLPPKMLKFEKSVTDVSSSASTDDSVYQNVTSCLSDSHLETSTSAALAPPQPPRPLSRTLSGDKPHPPPKPVKPAKPEVSKKPEVAKKPEKPPAAPDKPPVPVPAPRKTSKPPLEEQHAPIPAPRRTSPVPPIIDDNYSVPRQSTPNSKMSSTSSITPSEKSTSKSILETLMMEVGNEVLDETNDVMPVGVAGDIRAPDYTYASLGKKDSPPEIPKQTADSTQLLESDVSPLYETADLSVPLPTERKSPLMANRSVSPSSSSLAFSVATMKPSDVKPTKGRKFMDDSMHPGGSKTISTSPKKGMKPTAIGVGNSANSKYTFPGNYGYGVRVGKPKGPRPIPSHWNLINGITH